MTTSDSLNVDDPVIDIRSVSKRFGKRQILHDLNLTVNRGQTFAFLGRNGAGKTTTIRMLLGLHKPDTGTVRVLGLDPAKDAMEIRRRVGYLAEDQHMFGWMTCAQLIKFTAPFYPTWNDDWANHLAKKFELPIKTKVKHLSKGQSVRLGLLLALSHHPRLIILDDPTLGLDPIVRKEFLRDLVAHFHGSAVTIFFSSHLLYEVEPVADSVAILDRGSIVRHSPTEQLRDSVKQIIMPAFEYDSIAPLAGTLDVKRRGHQVAVVVEDVERAVRDVERTAATYDVIDLNLDEIFEAYVIGKRDGGKEGDHVPQPGLERVA
jgi:ABC-2 type transport system ATP-binding protein